MLKIIFTSFFCVCSIRIKFIVFYEWILLINNFLLMKTLPFKKANMFTDHKNRIYFSDTEINIRKKTTRRERYDGSTYQTQKKS